MPRYLLEAFQQQSSLKVYLENDTTNWARGAFYFQHLCNQTIEFPCLIVTYGTGLATIVAQSETDLTTFIIYLVELLHNLIL